MSPEQEYYERRIRETQQSYFPQQQQQPRPPRPIVKEVQSEDEARNFEPDWTAIQLGEKQYFRRIDGKELYVKWFDANEAETRLNVYVLKVSETESKEKDSKIENLTTKVENLETECKNLRELIENVSNDFKRNLEVSKPKNPGTRRGNTKPSNASGNPKSRPNTSN